MIFKYCNLLGVDILSNSRLKISTLPEINDPFDWSVSAEPSHIDKIRSQLFKDPSLIEWWDRIFKRHLIDISFSNPDAFISKIIEMQVRDMLRVIKDRQTKTETTYGLISFSTIPDIVPLWAHYGSNHAGLVFGFDETKFDVDANEIIQIEYNDEMPKFQVSARSIDEDSLAIIRASYSRKAQSWSYEKEKRLLAQLNKCHENGNYYVNISMSAIKQIYLGCRFEFTEALHKQIFDFHKTGGEVFRMTKSQFEYKLIPKLMKPEDF